MSELSVAIIGVPGGCGCYRLGMFWGQKGFMGKFQACGVSKIQQEKIANSLHLWNIKHVHLLY